MSKAKKGTSEDKNLDNLEAFEKRKRDIKKLFASGIAARFKKVKEKKVSKRNEED